MLLQLALLQTQLILGYSIQSQRFCHRFSTRIELSWSWLTLPPIQSHLEIFHGCSPPFLQSLCFSSSLADRLVYESSGTATKLIKLCSVRMVAHEQLEFLSMSAAIAAVEVDPDQYQDVMTSENESEWIDATKREFHSLTKNIS
jgi:hypothetical protein